MSMYVPVGSIFYTNVLLLTIFCIYISSTIKWQEGIEKILNMQALR